MEYVSKTLSRRGFLSALLVVPATAALVVTAAPADARGGPDPDERPGSKPRPTRSRRRRKYGKRVHRRNGHFRRRRTFGRPVHRTHRRRNGVRIKKVFRLGGRKH
ncbi:MAG: hypothetical protein AAFW87_09070 [Pseudomonadota bacterium]